MQRMLPALQSQTYDDNLSSYPCIIVHWNQPEAFIHTVKSLFSQPIPLRIILVDSGSQPEHLDRLKSFLSITQHPMILLAHEQNIGYGPGANIGLHHWLEEKKKSHAVQNWAFVAPHDVIVEKHTVEFLLDHTKIYERIGFISADVGDGHIPAIDPYFGGMTVASQQIKGWEDVAYPHGTFFAVSALCLEEIGFFDERYFSYGEEADIGFRATQAGWKVGLVHGARVHNPGTYNGSSVTDYLMHRNTFLFVRDHFGRYHAFIRVVIALWQLFRGLLQPKSRAWLYDPKGRMYAIYDFLRGRYGPPPKHLTNVKG